ncbi:hypothetical protein C7N83_07615 [Neisseria iguanae]|uniref:Bacteriocin n=2 Tax=Neisseria iguanae TaxID=90242 RepID=A0A2P7TZT4_9NEIS|nr:hypothetical protein C7N83_07615 [Neisseria iguanae]
MKELNIEDMVLVSGGVQWDKVGAGLGAVGIGLAAAAAAPVSVPVAVGANIFTFWGSVAIGDGLQEGNVIERTIGKPSLDKSGNDYGDGTGY